MHRRVHAAALISLLAATACSGRAGSANAPKTSELTVFAAASLSQAFTQIGVAFERTHPGTRVRFVYAGTQALVRQLEDGAPADVFASADEAHIQGLTNQGRVKAAAIIATNQLVIVTPRDNPKRLHQPFDLARPGVKVDLAAAAVPAGTLSRQALNRMEQLPGAPPGFAAAVLRNVVSDEENVEAVVSRVALGEVDAGIVYLSDLKTPNGQALLSIPIPDSANVINRYPIAVVAGSQHAELAQAFVDFVGGPVGQRILQDSGFGAGAV